MTDLLSDIDTPSDAELISRVRGGDVAAYGELFSRHKDAANRLARQLVRGPDSDDLVAEAFAKVLTVLQGGGGPDVAFRAYLLTAVRRLHVDRIRSGQRLQTTDDLTPFDPGVPFHDTAVAGFESGAAAKAFASLPERWQLVLWHLEVEGQKPADIAPLLGMSANSVSALAYRAREGLRQAFLTMHLADISETDCRWVNEHLGAFVRKGLSKRDAGKVQSHLDECRRCTAMHLELTEVNSNLAGIIAPLLLGAAAAGYLASGGAGAAGVLGLVSRVRDFVGANSGPVAAAGVAAGVAAAAVAALTFGVLGNDKPDVVADAPVGISSPAAPGSAGITPAPGATASSPVGTASASASPSTAVTPTISASASPSASVTASVSPFAALPTAPTPVTGGPVVGPSDLPTDSTAGPTDPTVGPTEPTVGPTEPTRTTPTPAPVVGVPVVDPDAGTVLATVQNMRSTDALNVAMTSADTTFASGQPAGCTVTGPRQVTCVPQLADGAGGRAAALVATTSDYRVTLPLEFPESMVEDDLQITAGLDDPSSAQTGAVSFRPTRQPRYDVRLAALGGPTAHDLAGDEDRWTVVATADLPPRVGGLRYDLTGGARFRSLDGAACTVGDDGTSLTCPDARAGDRVALPLAASGATGTVSPTVRVSALVDFADADPDNQARTVDLAPGTALGLRLDGPAATPARDGSVAVSGTVSGLRTGLRTLHYAVRGGAVLTAAGNPGCDVTGAAMTCPVPDRGDVRLGLRAEQAGTATPVTVTVEPGAPFESVGPPASAEVTLPGRPAYDFAMSDLTERGHTVSGDTDTYTLRSTVQPVPAGSGPLTFAVGDGATFGPDQDTGCTVDDPEHVTCGDLDTVRTVDFSVRTTATVRHDVAVTLQVPDAYDDEPAANNTGTITGLRPGTVLALTPHDLGTVHRGADANHPVTVRLSGVRAGVPSVVYRLTGRAAFAPVAGCVPAGDTLTCPDPADGEQPLLLHAEDATRSTPVGLSVEPGGDFVGLGDAGTATAVLAPTFDFAMTDLTLRGQTLVGDGTDRYTLRSSVGPLPPGVDDLTFTVDDGGTFAPDQSDGCTRLSDGRVRCGGLGDGGTVDFRVDSTSTSEHATTIGFATPAGYDDPQPGDHAGTVSGLRPGVDLRLTGLGPDGAPPADDAGRHRIGTTLTGVRTGLPRVTWTLAGDARFVATDAPRCTVAERSVTCEDPADGPVGFTVRADDPRVATDVTLAVAPAAPFLDLAPADNSDTVALAPRPSYDFSMGDLAPRGQTVTADTDHHTLRSTVGPVPPGVDALTFDLTEGGTFGSGLDAGCARLGDTSVRCDVPAAGRTVDFHVDSTRTDRHAVTVALRVPTRYDDPAAANDSGSAQVSPGVDLHLADLQPDNASPAADDDRHRVAVRLSGVRSGLTAVTYTLTGDATFVRASGSRCTGTGTVLTCTDPGRGNGTEVLTVRADDPRSATPITITAAPVAPFVETDASDNADAVTLAPRPTHDFSIAGLTEVDHTLAGDTDSFVLRARLGAVPAGSGPLGLALTGGTFPASPGDGCSRVDDSHVTCGDLASARAVDLRVLSTSAEAHPVTVAVQVPAAYHDPDATDDRATLRVAPGVDLALAALTPADPVPSADGTSRVTGRLTGVRGDLPSVTLTVSGRATVTDTSCTRTDASTVTCADPVEGQPVSLSLKADRPLSVTPVTIRAEAPAPYVELGASDNTRTTTLAPDVVLESVDVLRHRDGNRQVLVRAQVAGIPDAAQTLRLRLTGADVGLEADQVHLTDGGNGADGQGTVDCYTSDASGNAVAQGTYATCVRVTTATTGRFYVDLRLAHRHGTASDVRFTVMPVGVPEDGDTANNSRELTIG